jgi:hypothetical protein
MLSSPWDKQAHVTHDCDEGLHDDGTVLGHTQLMLTPLQGVPLLLRDVIVGTQPA